LPGRAADEFVLPPELRSLEAELTRLRPRGDRLDRDRLLFQAGRASAVDLPPRQVGWGWPAVLAAVTALAASLLVAIVTRPGPQVVERVVRVPVEQLRESPPSPVPAPGRSEARSENLVAVPERPSRLTLPRSRSTMSAGIIAAILFGRPETAGVRLPTGYPQLLEQALADTLDPRDLPPAVPRGSDTRPAAPPASYRNLLDSLLEPNAGHS
jgi:hypothetical protein